jgi:hypothetical protein
MTLFERLQALRLGDAINATVGDIVETMLASGWITPLVIEEPQGECHVLSFFSISEIGRQLGVELEPHSRALTSRTRAGVGARSGRHARNLTRHVRAQQASGSKRLGFWRISPQAARWSDYVSELSGRHPGKN